MGSDRPVARRARHDAGTVVVIVAASMGALLVMVALVLDLGGARRDRDADQVAADAMALAAAADLGSSQSSAAPACRAAWDYLVVNLPTVETAPAPSCATFAATCVPATAREVEAVFGSHRVTFTHPVPDGHVLLAGQTAGRLDGPACDRFGIRVRQDRANLLTTGSVQLDLHAVGRLIRGIGDVDAPLILLQEHACEVLTVNGTGALAVETSTGEPGYIAIDSDGTGCTNPRKVIIDIDGSGTVEAGVISMWALADGDASGAYSNNVVDPIPTPSSARVGREAMDWKYNCSPDNGCPDPGPAHLDDLVADWGGAAEPQPPGSFTRWTTGGFSCSPSGDTVVPAGNWYIDCGAGGLSTGGSLTFQGGNIVSDGPIAASGGLRVNCSDATPGDTTAPAVCPSDPPSASILYLRSGNLARHGTVELHETFVYAAAGTIDLAGTAQLTWTAPDDPAHPFDDLLTWTENPTAIELHGSTDMTIEGIIFAPNAEVLMRGTSGLAGLGTQIFADSLDLAGTANLRLAPSSDRILQVGRGRPVLIR